MTPFGGTIGVIGGGAWGTALAVAAARHVTPDGGGRRVVLWMRDASAAAAMKRDRVNARHLPEVALPDAIRPTADPGDLAGAGALLLAVPTQQVRTAVSGLRTALPPGVPLVSCAKGIERDTGLFPSGVLAELRPGAPVAVLSGPSFAADVAAGLPTAVTVAAADPALAAALAGALSGPTFRVYHSIDTRGIEIGGAAKNVLAIAVGIVEGRGLGRSAGAALTARGFAELGRCAAALGGRAETLAGLSGLGDLVLTCGPGSRNFAFGLALGRGADVAEASAGRLAEGAWTADALVALARGAGIDMPVAEAVAAVVAGRLSVDDAVRALMTRPLRAE